MSPRPTMRCGSCGDSDLDPEDVCPGCHKCSSCCGCGFDEDELGVDPEEAEDYELCLS